MYSDLYFQSKKRISIFLVLFVLLGIIGMSVYFLRYSSLPSRASKITLTTHEVVNINALQAGIFWKTEEPSLGWIIFGEKKDVLDKVGLDDRDMANSKNSMKYHFVSLRNLKENTTYYYKIVNDNNVVADNSGEPFTFTTAKSGGTSASLRPAYGKIAQVNGEPATNAFVILRYPNAIPLMTTTKLSGEWLIPLQYVFNAEDLTRLTVNTNDKITIEIITEEDIKSTVQTIINNTNPISQTLILGNDYTLLDEDNVLPASTQSNALKDTSDISITFPKEGAVIPGSTPIIKGFALPQQDVSITVKSKTGYIYRVKADTDGVWLANITTPLSAGDYSLEVKTKNNEGKEVSLTRHFTIAKSGEQVLGDATPSGTLSPSPSVTDDPTPTTDLSVTPTDALTPTDVPTFTPTMVATTSATPAPPTSGFSLNPIVIGSTILLLLGTGLMFVF